MEEWSQKLVDLEESSFHIAEIERTLLRKVGGYDALEYLFQLPDLAKTSVYLFCRALLLGISTKSDETYFHGKTPCVSRTMDFLPRI